jgi:hypothetical protein
MRRPGALRLPLLPGPGAAAVRLRPAPGSLPGLLPRAGSAGRIGVDRPPAA